MTSPNTMGMGLNAVHLLVRTLPPLSERSKMTVLTLGVQDCHFTYEEIVSFLARHGFSFEPLPPSERQLTNGFTWAAPDDRKKFSRCIHQRSLFRLLGFLADNIRSMDVSDFEGADIVHDLNVPVDPALHSAFDVVLDGGTVEHVFSTKDALFNVCRLCRVGGIAVSIGPIDYVNHGFVNLSAELLRGCFRTNGFEEIALKYIAVPTHPSRVNQHYLEYDPDDYRSTLRPYYATVVFSAYKKVAEKPLVVPTQGFYVNLHAPAPSPNPAASGRLRSVLLTSIGSWTDSYFLSSVVFRSLLGRRRGKKVIL